MFSRICCATRGSDLPRGSAGPAAAITSLGAAGPAGNFSKHQLGAVGGGELEQGLAGSERSQLSLCPGGAGGILDLTRQFPITRPSCSWIWDRASPTILAVGRGIGWPQGMGEREFTPGLVDQGSLLGTCPLCAAAGHCSALKSRQREDESISTWDQSPGSACQRSQLWLPKQLSWEEERLCNPAPGRAAEPLQRCCRWGMAPSLLELHPGDALPCLGPAGGIPAPRRSSPAHSHNNLWRHRSDQGWELRRGERLGCAKGQTQSRDLGCPAIPAPWAGFLGAQM